jgi:hypothetical protein
MDKGLGVDRRAAVFLKLKKAREEATALFLLLAFSGIGGVAQPSRSGLREQLPKQGLGTARFS